MDKVMAVTMLFLSFVILSGVYLFTVRALDSPNGLSPLALCVIAVCLGVLALMEAISSDKMFIFPPLMISLFSPLVVNYSTGPRLLSLFPDFDQQKFSIYNSWFLPDVRCFHRSKTKEVERRKSSVGILDWINTFRIWKISILGAVYFHNRQLPFVLMLKQIEKNYRTLHMAMLLM